MCKDHFLCFVTGSDATVEELPWGTHDWLVRDGLTDSKHMRLVRVTMPAGCAHQFHRHPEMEEALYFLSGKAEQWVAGKSQIMEAGDVAHIPLNEVHGTYNIFDEPVVFLAMLAVRSAVGPDLIDVSQEEPWCSLKSPVAQ